MTVVRLTDRRAGSDESGRSVIGRPECTSSLCVHYGVGIDTADSADSVVAAYGHDQAPAGRLKTARCGALDNRPPVRLRRSRHAAQVPRCERRRRSVDQRHTVDGPESSAESKRVPAIRCRRCRGGPHSGNGATGVVGTAGSGRSGFLNHVLRSSATPYAPPRRTVRRLPRCATTCASLARPFRDHLLYQLEGFLGGKRGPPDVLPDSGELEYLITALDNLTPEGGVQVGDFDVIELRDHEWAGRVVLHARWHYLHDD